MISLQDFKRLIAPLQKKVFLLLGRGVLKLVNNAQGTQKIQIVCLAGEIISNGERFQEYGLETYPHTEAETVTLFLNGNRDQGITIKVHDRRYRPTDLEEGDTMLYTSEDNGGDHRVHLDKSDKSITVIGDQVRLGNATWGSLKRLIHEEFFTFFDAHIHTSAAPGNPTTPPTILSPTFSTLVTTSIARGI